MRYFGPIDGRGERLCQGCGVTKSRSEFYFRTDEPAMPVVGRCRPCERVASKARRGNGRGAHDPEYRRNRHLVRTYGITLVERDAMLAAQGGCCALCPSAQPRCKQGWHTDHDHETGVIRGILCNSCNMVLGIFEAGWALEGFAPLVSKCLDHGADESRPKVPTK